MSVRIFIVNGREKNIQIQKPPDTFIRIGGVYLS